MSWCATYLKLSEASLKVPGFALPLASCAVLEPRPPQTPASKGWVPLEAGSAPVRAGDRLSERLDERDLAVSGAARVWELSPPDGWSKLSSLSLHGRLQRHWLRAGIVERWAAINEFGLNVSGATLTRRGEHYIVRSGVGFSEEADPIVVRPRWHWFGHVLGTYHFGGRTFLIFGGSRGAVFGDELFFPLLGLWHEFPGGWRGQLLLPYAAVLAGAADSLLRWEIFARADGGRTRLAMEASELSAARGNAEELSAGELSFRRVKVGAELSLGSAWVQGGVLVSREIEVHGKNSRVRHPDPVAFVRVGVSYRFDDGDGIRSLEELQFEDLGRLLPD